METLDRHSIAQSDLLGFSREEQKLLAALVRAHRRKFPVSVFKQLPAQQRSSTKRLAILLRLSALLHHSRFSIPLPEPRLRVKEKRVTLEFPAGWLRRHSLTGAWTKRRRISVQAATRSIVRDRDRRAPRLAGLDRLPFPNGGQRPVTMAWHERGTAGISLRSPLWP